MIEIEGKKLYNMLRMLSGIDDEFRMGMHYDSEGFEVTLPDKDMTSLLHIDCKKEDLVSCERGDESGREVGIDINTLLPFVTKHKKGNIKIVFDRCGDDLDFYELHVSSGEESIVCNGMKLAMVRRSPNYPALLNSMHKDVVFNSDVKFFKEMFKILGCKSDSVIIWDTYKDDMLQFTDNTYNKAYQSNIKLERLKICDKYKEVITYKLFNKYLKKLPNATFHITYRYDSPLMMTLNDIGFENTYILAPRIID